MYVDNKDYRTSKIGLILISIISLVCSLEILIPCIVTYKHSYLGKTVQLTLIIIAFFFNDFLYPLLYILFKKKINITRWIWQMDRGNKFNVYIFYNSYCIWW